MKSRITNLSAPAIAKSKPELFRAGRLLTTASAGLTGTIWKVARRNRPSIVTITTEKPE